jgi:hypothetical protein
MMNDWAEGHHTIKELTRQMYEAMLTGNFKKAMELCDQIVVEARITRAKIGAQHEN